MGKNKKIGIIICAILIGVVSAFTGWYFTLREGVEVGNKLYYRVSDNKFSYKSNYLERISDHEFKIIIDKKERVVRYEKNAYNDMRFEFPEGNVIVGNWTGNYFSDNIESIIGTVKDYTNPDDYKLANREQDLAYCTALCQAIHKDYQTSSDWKIMIAGILLYVVGLLGFFYSEEIDYLLHGWKYEKPELSNDGILSYQIGGIVIAIIGVVLMSGVLFWFTH